MRIGSGVLVLLAVAILVIGRIEVGRVTPTERKAEVSAARDRTAYTLPPDKLQKAIALDRTERRLTVAGTVWPIVELGLILWVGVAAWMRDLSLSVSRWRWLQAFVFVFCVLLVLFVLDLPLAMYAHTVGLQYGLSVQGWGSWFGDRGKTFALEWAIGGVLVWLAAWVIRRSPQRWWFWFWIPASACLVATVFISPYVIEPLFYKYEPLEKVDPALVARLEQVIARGGLSIPPERMFLMRASAKSTEMNAYVTGFGASKRVVVWDTTVAKSSPDEILYVFAHEMGHYALGHVVWGTVLGCVAFLPFFWVGYQGVRLLLGWFGARWRIPSQEDWCALVVLALVLLVVSVLFDPFANSFSRHIEHDADVYGQEAVHGIVADPQGLGKRSFQLLGEDSLDDPTPHPLFEFWFDTHPTIPFRAAFAEAYDPWRVGEHPKYFAK